METLCFPLAKDSLASAPQLVAPWYVGANQFYEISIILEIAFKTFSQRFLSLGSAYNTDEYRACCDYRLVVSS
jgi:hypothetical protein